jgi:hypothetical protein
MGHPQVANFNAECGGMTHCGSLSLHAILEELPSEGDSSLSEGESSDSPLLRACNTMIPATPSLLHCRWRRPRHSRPHRPDRSGPLHQQPSLSTWQLIWRDDNALRRMTSIEGLCSIEAGSPASGRPWRQGWPIGSNVKQRWRQARSWQRSKRSGSSPPPCLRQG